MAVQETAAVPVCSINVPLHSSSVHRVNCGKSGRGEGKRERRGIIDSNTGNYLIWDKAYSHTTIPETSLQLMGWKQWKYVKQITLHVHTIVVEISQCENEYRQQHAGKGKRVSWKEDKS